MFSYECFLKMFCECIQTSQGTFVLFCHHFLCLHCVNRILKDMKGTVKVKEAHAGPLKTVVMIWGGEFEVFYIRFFFFFFFMSYFS